MTEQAGQPLYESVASTPEGGQALASARLRHDVLSVLHTVYAASDLDYDDLAERTDFDKTEIKDVFEGDGNITLHTLAMLLCALGFEAEVGAVRLGTARAQFLKDAEGEA